MKRFLILSLFVSAASFCSAQVDADVQYHVTVLSSAEARARVAEPTRIVRELTQLVSVLHLSPQKLPNIVVIYADAKAARIDGLPDGAKVTVAKITIADQPLYQVWVTGLASDANTIEGLIWAVNRHFDLKLTADRINAVREQVVRQMGGIVGVGELVKESVR